MIINIDSEELFPFEDKKNGRVALYRYRRNAKWHVYEQAGYSIKNKKDAEDLISEVSEEMNVSRSNVKLAKLKTNAVEV